MMFAATHSSPRRAAILLAVWFCLLGGHVHAAQPPYLDEMPDPALVLREIGGKDELDTAARQFGAMTQLINMIQLMSDGRVLRQNMTPDESRVRKAYVDARLRLRQPEFSAEESQRLGLNSPRAKWFGSRTRYENSDELKTELLNRFFSPEWIANYRTIEARESAKLTDYQRRRELENKSQQERFKASAESRRIEREVESALFLLSDPSGKPQTALRVSMGLIGVLVLIGLLGEARGPQLEASLPGTLSVGAKNYMIHSLTGIVREPTRTMETVVSVSGGYDRPVSSSSRTNLHEQFFLHEPGGRETAIQLVNTNIPMRDGHLLSAVWVVRKGKSRAPFILFKNHSTGDVRLLQGSLGALLRPRKRILLGLLGLAWMFSLSVTLQALSSIEDEMPSRTTLLSGPLLSLAAVVLFLVYRAVLTALRLGRFKRKFQPLYDLLDIRASQLAAGGVPAPGGAAPSAIQSPL